MYFLKDNPQYSSILSGHADREGDDELNMSISRYRVEVVKKYFTSYNIQETRISSFLNGRMKLISMNIDSNQWMNRRVEVMLIKNQ